MDRSNAYQQDYFRRVRRRTVMIQLMAPLALLAVAVADRALTGNPLSARWLPLVAGLVVIGLLMQALARVTHIATHGWVTIAMLCTAELTIAFTITPTPFIVHWVLPILFVIPVAAAPFWIWHTRLVAACLLCDACAYVALYRSGPSLADNILFAGLAVLFLCVSIAIYRSIDQLRRSAYEFQMDLDHAARHDALTGLLSRRPFMFVGEAVVAESRAFSVCFIDLDWFKQVNDRHGHAAGDKVLSWIATHLVDNAPRDAVVARMGGEEFVVLLPGSGEAQAASYAESLRRNVQDSNIGGSNVTLSIGVAAHRTGESLQQTLQRADRALLEAKRRGRNRVEVTPG